MKHNDNYFMPGTRCTWCNKQILSYESKIQLGGGWFHDGAAKSCIDDLHLYAAKTAEMRATRLGLAKKRLQPQTAPQVAQTPLL